MRSSDLLTRTVEAAGPARFVDEMSNSFSKDSHLNHEAAKQQHHMLHPTIYNPQLPFSSPIPDDQRSVQSTNTYQTHNPFISPDPSWTPSAGEESDSMYGQDEFPLERYSQRVRNETSNHNTMGKKPQTNLISQSLDDSTSKRLRPGLNIITDFSRADGRSLANGIVVEKVHASRPQAGHRSVASVASEKVEHGFQTPQLPPPPPSGFVSLKDLTKLRQQDNYRGKLRQVMENATSSTNGKTKNKSGVWRKTHMADDEINNG